MQMTNSKFFLTAAATVLAAGAIGVAVAQNATPPQPSAPAAQPYTPSAPAESTPSGASGMSNDTGGSMPGNEAPGAGTASGDSAPKADRN
jgi:hypothetical protein